MSKEITIKLKKLNERAVIPTYAHDGDVCMDFTAIDVEYDEENDLYIYHTGLAFESEFYKGMFIYPRSSNRKTEAYLTNSVGVIDTALYRGEILFCYRNRDSLETISDIAAFKAILLNSDSDIKPTEIFDEIKTDYKKRASIFEFAPYKVGDRVGQFVLFDIPKINIEVVDELNDSVRGTNGFGSSGN